MDAVIDGLRAKILDLQRAARDKTRAVDALKAQAKLVDDRLADPDRLRPAPTFVSYLTDVTNRVIAFLLLSLAIGAGLDPISMSFGSAAFDARLVRLWNRLRSGRYQVVR